MFEVYTALEVADEVDLGHDCSDFTVIEADRYIVGIEDLVEFQDGSLKIDNALKRLNELIDTVVSEAFPPNRVESTSTS